MCRTRGLHQIERERGAAALIGVEDAKPRIKANGEGRDPRLRLEHCVHQVQHCVAWGRGSAGRCGERRAALPDVSQCRGYAWLVARNKSHRNSGPCLPVGAGALGLEHPELAERLAR